jgi:hypothetical protein
MAPSSLTAKTELEAELGSAGNNKTINNINAIPACRIKEPGR